MVQLKEDERLDYLLAEDMRIIQSPSVFSFSTDAVLLAHFSYLPIHKGKVVDLCSGNGIIPLLLSARTNVSITGVEIQERLYDMAQRSVEYNDRKQQISMVQGDVKEIDSLLHHSHYDVVTCNPPYFNTPPGDKRNVNEHYAIARHEILCSLEDTIKASSYLLKQGGKAAFVHRPGRLMDIMMLMRKHRLEPKRLRFVYPKPGREANTILIEGIKDGKPDLKILPPLYVYDEHNQYSQEVHDMLYGKNKKEE
ncbi:tRNA1(Val) (adenine(37)-N6)-methyltransferase [Bacillus sp. KH172YL63]|uniref:tRNA1(Val) (adenine(37)-N6)-methyltransferase n=1 Tax=Bacillus sp. KH172YL63 TaxID=2709784 RepID=UPI001566BBD7|nr:tRNA1(Val) (adenine(37)-N6)-methyltransferase [Bacillus sp. KH172YL63]